MTDLTCDIYTTKVKSLKKTSPASLISNRAIALSRTESIVASDNKVIKIKIELPKIENKIFSKIKGIPSPFKIETSGETIYDTKLKYEIQSLSSSRDNSKISAIDSSGSVWVSNYNDDDNSEIVHSYSINYDNDKFTELGWAGSSFNTKDSTIIAKTQFYQKNIQIFKGDQLSQTIQLIQNPTQIQYFDHEKSQTSLLALTEFNQLKIYDPRQSTNNCCIQKFTPGTSWLYSMAISSNSEYIAVGGSSRTVSVFDTKRWNNSGNWKNCLKYEITNIEFSNTRPSICYVGGLDSEVLAGEWNGSSGVDHFTGLRVDSKWLGLSKLKDEEYIFGYTGSSSIYYIDHCDKLFQGSLSEKSLHNSLASKQEKKQQHQLNNQLKKQQQQPQEQVMEENDNENKESNETNISKARHIEGSPKGDEKHQSKKLKKEE
ncbi:hypothetical protein RB653_005886 [Dictyostelium firmibasis]|uniref:Uncharacterized protein n=1 Tax=Dictyostelium firmibasis TaxID=79012 RepID=A0AAN7UC90_9MYCE